MHRSLPEVVKITAQRLCLAGLVRLDVVRHVVVLNICDPTTRRHFSKVAVDADGTVTQRLPSGASGNRRVNDKDAPYIDEVNDGMIIIFCT